MKEEKPLISDYDRYHKEYFKSLTQPKLILVFNSHRGLLEMRGFPYLEKEIAEILESGRIQDFCPIQYIKTIEKFASIEQRWGR